jgi:Spy/CpxP family protein refolding chaperone
MVRTRLDIRNVLTDEQKVMFDARRGMQGKDGKRRAMHGQAGQKRQMPYAGQGRQGMQRGQRMAMKGMKQGKGQGMKGSQGMGAGQHHGQAMNGHGKHGQRKGMQGQQDMSGMKDLTQEQKDKMKELRLQQMKTMTQYSNQLGEYNARLKTLTTGDDVKLKDVDKLIDKMGKVKLEMAKYRLSHRMDVRALLTDEQKVMFDMHAMKGRHEGRRML